MKISDITNETFQAFKVIKSDPTAGTDLQSPDQHTTIHLDPDASKGIVQDPNNPNNFSLNPAVTGQQQTQMGKQGPAIGTQVTMLPQQEEAGEEEVSPRHRKVMIYKIAKKTGWGTSELHLLSDEELQKVYSELFTHEEGHRDLISQGNRDVGGDATDNFINQVIDQEFEKANRNSPGIGTRSPISHKLKESDELYKWLTIAGIK